MDFFLHRATSLATASIPLPARERPAAHAPDRPAFRWSAAARSLTQWVLWLLLLILPGSFLLLPVLFWWRSRRNGRSTLAFDRAN